MNSLKGIHFLLGWFFFAGCSMSHFQPPSRIALEEEKILDLRYEKYGAYFLNNDVYMEFTVDHPQSYGQTLAGNIVLYKRLKILNSESKGYGTFEIEKYSDVIPQLKVTLFSSPSDSVVLSSEFLIKEFKKTGKIAVPQVKAGSIITVEIHFKIDLSQVMGAFEVWLSESLPVANATFTLSTENDYRFEAREYGGLTPPASKRVSSPLNSSVLVRTWKANNLFPSSQVNMKSPSDLSLPRVSVVFRKFRGEFIYFDWPKMVSIYQKYMLKKSIFNQTQKLEHLADSLSKVNLGKQKYAAAFAWVKKNIRLAQRPIGPINIGSILQTGEGNKWEISVLLRELMTLMGDQSDILITRERDLGGFDSGFATPLALTEPFVLLNTANESRVAYLFSEGAALGEYPESFFGLQGLSINTGKPISLPPSIAPQGNQRFKYTLNAKTSTDQAILDVELKGFSGYAFRNLLAGLTDVERQEQMQAMLDEGSENFILNSFHLKGVETPNTPLTAHILFHFAEPWVEKKNQRFLSLKTCFNRYYQSWDSSRTSPISIRLSDTVIEEIRIEGQEKSLTNAFLCYEIENDLFKQTCYREGENLLRRTVLRKPGTFEPLKVKSLLPAIDSLNACRNSHILVKDP